MKYVRTVNGNEKLMDNQAVKGAFSLTLSAIIIKLLGLIYKLPLSNILGDEGMGYFNSAYTVYSFFYIICTAGVPKAVMMILSEEESEGRSARNSKIIRHCLTIFSIIGILVTIFFVILSQPISRAIGNSKSALTMLAIAPSILFVSLSGVLRGLLSAEMGFLDISISQILEGISKLVFGLIFASLGAKLMLPLQIISALTILGVTLGSIIGCLYLFVCSKKQITSVKTGQNGIMDAKSIISKLFSISIPITISAAVMSITNMLDLVLIMRNLIKLGYTESEAAAYFGNYTTLAVPIFNLALSLITPISVSFMPIITKSRYSKNFEETKLYENRALELTALISAPITLGVMLFSREILSILFKNSRIEVGSILLILLAPAIVFSSVLIVINTILESAGYVKAPIISMSIAGVAKFLVSYILIRNPHFGISGAPIGTVISFAIALLISLLIHQRKLGGGLPILSQNLKCYFSALISIVPARVVYNYLHIKLELSISLLLSISIAGVIYLICSILLGIISFKKWNIMSYSTKLLL